MKRKHHQGIEAVFCSPQETFKRKIESDKTTTIFCGTDYFPIKGVHRIFRKKKTFKRNVQHIFVSLGGATAVKDSLALAQILDKTLDPNIQITVVLGWTEKKTCKGLSRRVNVMAGLNDLAEVIYQSNLGIIAGGFVKFECMCIGTPIAFVSLNRHQQILSKAYAEKGHGIYLGTLKGLIQSPKHIQKLLTKFIASEQDRRAMFKRNRSLVDGRGINRIQKIIEQNIQLTKRK